jgi:5-methylcytosine-specific restriction endonuclease McrA
MSLAQSCPHPHCGRAVVREGRCARHQRPSAAARGYGGEWTAVARAWVRAHPWCGERLDGRLYAEHSLCVQQGERVRARIADHIRSLARDGARLDPANLQSLCVRCNRVKGG